jgi:DNA-binding transcriptional MerR regulator
VSWSISEVARMSGITARTLRHYDQVGLLPPAFTDPSGRRHYRTPELLRLQRILLLRELGMGLDAVAAALDDDPMLALRRHLDWLARERDRYDRLLGTVRTTIDALERGGTMDGPRLFEGFEHDPHEAQARERFGDAAVDAASERMAGWTPDDAQRARTGFDRTRTELAALRADGATPEDPRVQDVVADHYRTVCLFWTPDADAYRGLGRLYLDDDRFLAAVGGGDRSLVEFLSAAMDRYAATRLS